MMAEDGIIASAELLWIGQNVIPSFRDLLGIHQIVSGWYQGINLKSMFLLMMGFCVCVSVCICKATQKNLKRG